MVIPNMVMEFQNVDIFENCVQFLTRRLHFPAAWKALKEGYTSNLNRKVVRQSSNGNGNLA